MKKTMDNKYSMHEYNNGDKSDNLHDNQMLYLGSLEGRGLSSKRKRMEMRSEFQAFLAQSLELKASTNMSQLMYDPNYKFPQDCNLSGNPNWQIFLDCNVYNPSLLGFGEFKVAAMRSLLVEVMSGESPRALDHSEDGQLRIVGSAAIKENWTDKLVFALPEWSTSSCYDSSGHSPEYYKTRDAFINTLQRSLGALIKRNQDVATICKDLLLNTNGNIVVDTHPDHKNSANVQDNDGKCMMLIGHYALDCQGTEGVTTKNGETTCLTYDQFLAASQKINPDSSLLDLTYTDDVAPIKFPFHNAKGQKFSAMRDVFANFTLGELTHLISKRCHHYFQNFVDMLRQGCKDFRIVFYGEGKHLHPLFVEAFCQAKEYVCTNCNALAAFLEEVELKTIDVTHWSAVIHPLTLEQRIRMDAGVALLHGGDVALSTYFQEGNFTHLQFGKGTGQDMLSCLIAILKGNSSTVLLDTILKSNVDKENSKYSSFDIPDRILVSRLQSYLRKHASEIFKFVTSEPNGAPIPSTVDDLTVHDLAWYLSFQRWKGMTAEERMEAMMPAHRALADNRDNCFFSRIDELSAYKDEHGHLNVCRTNKDQSLYDFCFSMRCARKAIILGRVTHRKLTDDRIAALDAVGFDWNLCERSRAVKWMMKRGYAVPILVAPGKLGLTVKYDQESSLHGGARIDAINMDCAIQDKVSLGEIIITVQGRKVSLVNDLHIEKGRTREFVIIPWSKVLEEDCKVLYRMVKYQSQR